MGSRNESGPPSTQTVTTETQVPGFLQPFVERQAEIGLGGLESLNDLLSFERQPEFIDERVQVGTRQVPMPGQPTGGAGGFAGGFGAEGGGNPFLRRRMAQAQPQFTTEPIFETRQVANPAFDPNFDPDQAAADRLVAPFNPDQQAAFNQIRGIAGGAGGFIPTAQQTLLDTARGDFLFGGQGFNEAVDASVRAAQPHILSTFGGGGRGTGGLAQAAIAQQATDAFASQFGQERARQLAAAQALPGIATTGANLLGDIGAIQQQQRQRELMAPITAAESLLSAAGGGVPLQSLLGQTQTGVSQQGFSRNVGASALGGASAGAGIGASFGGPLGAGIGAGAGALFGLLG